MVSKNFSPDIGKNTQFKPGQSGNPAGKPKGTKHISTYIKEMMEDENFEANILDSKVGLQQYKGKAVIAMLHVAMQHALNDKNKAVQYMDFLAKYGYGTNIEGNAEEINIKYEVVNRVPKPKE